jgi:cobalt-zinc-cadmium efflux system protein
LFVAIEMAMGFWTNSLALLADAGHNLSDCLGLLLAWVAHYLTSFKPSTRRTYGWKSSSIMVAVFNSQILLIAVGGIFWEACQRFLTPETNSGSTMVWVAAAGVGINAFSAWLFMRGQADDLNVRGAFLHLAADAAVSLGVVIAGLAIIWTGQAWIDPVTSLIIAAVILISTWTLMRESMDLALHAVPRHIEMPAVKQFLLSLPGVTQVHDLHVWAMSTTETAMTAHLVKPVVEDEDQLLLRVHRELHERFGIDHPTLQIERTSDHCQLAPDDVV